MFDTIRPLLDVRGDPAVTIVMPLDRRRPGNDKDRIRLRNLHTEARNRVLAAYDHRLATPVLERLDEAVSSVDLHRPGHGVVVFATSGLAESRMTPFPVQEAVAVDGTLLTRSLVQGLRRSPRYRVLVLSDKPTRLFEAVRDDLVEVTDHGFPMAAKIVPVDRRAVAGRFALAGAGDDRDGSRAFYRQVDGALREAARDDPLPVVLVGVARSVARFDHLSRHRNPVIGRIYGSYDFASPHDLGRIVWPAARAYLRHRRRQAISELAEAVGQGRAVTGIDEVWTLARHGRGHLLVVEEDYRAEPSLERDDRLTPAPHPDGAGVIEDPVDEVVETVVRDGGEVEFVASGALDALGRIGLVLR